MFVSLLLLSGCSTFQDSTLFYLRGFLLVLADFIIGSVSLPFASGLYDRKKTRLSHFVTHTLPLVVCQARWVLYYDGRRKVEEDKWLSNRRKV